MKAPSFTEPELPHADTRQPGGIRNPRAGRKGARKDGRKDGRENWREAFHGRAPEYRGGKPSRARARRQTA